METNPFLWLPKPFNWEEQSNPVFDRFVANLKAELLRMDTDHESQRMALEHLSHENVALCIDESDDESTFSLAVLTEVHVYMECTRDEIHRCGLPVLRYQSEVDPLIAALAINNLDQLDRHILAVDLANDYLDFWPATCRKLRESSLYRGLELDEDEMEELDQEHELDAKDIEELAQGSGLDADDIEELAQEQEANFIRDLPILYERIRRGTLEA